MSFCVSNKIIRDYSIDAARAAQDPAASLQDLLSGLGRHARRSVHFVAERAGEASCLRNRGAARRVAFAFTAPNKRAAART